MVAPKPRAKRRWAGRYGPGCRMAEMAPGQHHLRLNVYIAQSQGGAFKVVKNLGPIDPKEGEVIG